MPVDKCLNVVVPLHNISKCTAQKKVNEIGQDFHSARTIWNIQSELYGFPAGSNATKRVYRLNFSYDVMRDSWPEWREETARQGGQGSEDFEKSFRTNSFRGCELFDFEKKSKRIKKSGLSLQAPVRPWQMRYWNIFRKYFTLFGTE